MNKRYSSNGKKSRKGFKNRATKTHRMNVSNPLRGGIRL